MQCKCTMVQSLLGDGCDACNPEYALDMAKQTIEDLEGQVAELEKALSDIKRHQKIVSAGKHEETGAWQIADKALGR